MSVRLLNARLRAITIHQRGGGDVAGRHETGKLGKGGESKRKRGKLTDSYGCTIAPHK